VFLCLDPISDDCLKGADDGIFVDSEWVRFLDEDSGAHYFYNVKTGSTSWHHPHGALPSARSAATRFGSGSHRAITPGGARDPHVTMDRML